MNRRFLGATALSCLVCGGSALAQGTLGEIQSKGAKRLAKDELVRLLQGATVRGENNFGSEISVDYKADGTIIGSVLPAKGKRAGEMAGIYGTWKVEDNGRLCVKSTKVLEDRTYTACGFYFRVGREYFTSGSESDPKARLMKRTIERRRP